MPARARWALRCAHAPLPPRSPKSPTPITRGSHTFTSPPNTDPIAAYTSHAQVRLLLDARTHGSSRLPHAPLAALQGPALLCFNDAQFTETDFKSIQRIGDSLKKETSQGAKTGRFGA
jgi:hypothetical protein